VASNGNVWAYQTTVSPTRGINLSNQGNETAYRPGVVLQGYSGSGAAGGRSWLVFENARGTAASPVAVGNGDRIVEMIGQGYNGVQWTGDAVQNQPFSLRGAATEAWTDSPSRAGMRLEVLAQPAGVNYTGTSVDTIISHAPTTATYRADAWAFRTRTAAAGGTNTLQLSMDSSGNVTTGSNATVGSNLRVNGNVIQASDGNTNITLNSNTMTTFAGGATATGNLTVNGGGTSIIKTNDFRLTNSTGGYIFTVADTGSSSGTNFTFKDPNANNVNQLLVGLDSTTATYALYGASATGATTPTVQYFGYRRSGGVNSATQTNDRLGQFRFNGNTNTSTGSPTAPVTGGEIRVYATENWTNTQTGTGIGIEITRTGTTDNTNVFISDAVSTYIKGDTISLQTGVEASPIGITGDKLVYNRVYGQWVQNGPINPVAANTSYVFAPGTATDSNIASVVSTSRITPGAAGLYNLQFSLQWNNADNSEHTFYVWLRKNGTNVSNSTGKVVCLKSADGINSWNYIVNSANTTDYWELAYQVSNTAITFPYVAGSGTAPNDIPGAPALITTLTPVGA